MSRTGDTLIAAGFFGVIGAVGGAVSAFFFNSRGPNKTAMKIVGLGAFQGAVVQSIGIAIGYNTAKPKRNNDKRVAIIHLVSAAILTVAAKVLLGTTYKEAFANCAISYAVPWSLIQLAIEKNNNQ